ncbi:MAG: hypothetical protein ACFFD2_04710 [Promethearchaeota archaeon]
MVEIEDFFKMDDIYSIEPEKIEPLRLEIIKKAAMHHFEHCTPYKKICRKNNFNPVKDLKSYQDIKKIPWITSKSFKKSYNLFKNLISVSEDKIVEWLHSSGTSGDPSYVGRDQKTLDRFRVAGTRSTGLILDRDRFQMGIVFGPSPEMVKGLTFALGMDIWTKMCDNSIYLMKERREKGKIPIDIQLTIKSIKEAEAKKEVCFFGGAPALAYFTLAKFHEQTGETFQLNEQSVGGGFGGGWKTFTGQQISKDQFRKTLNKILGIPIKNLRDTYALTESDIVFQECEEFVFHVPPWGDIIIRDPETMAPVKKGEKGLINVINPIAYSWPGISVLLDDTATFNNNGKCKCGRYGKTFSDVGRAVGADARGCGAMITDLAEND